MDKQDKPQGVHPGMRPYFEWFAPPHDEQAAIEADLAYQHMKDSGELHRRESERALRIQVQGQP